MKNYLLDTHVFLWAYSRPEKLSAPVARVVVKPGLGKFISAATLWECAHLLETRPGELRINQPLATYLDQALQELQVSVLHVTPQHAQRYYEIQPLRDHGDPFDRMILAQASATGFTLVSSDGRFPTYARNGLITLMEN